MAVEDKYNVNKNYNHEDHLDLEEYFNLFDPFFKEIDFSTDKVFDDLPISLADEPIISWNNIDLEVPQKELESCFSSSADYGDQLSMINSPKGHEKVKPPKDVDQNNICSFAIKKKRSKTGSKKRTSCFALKNDCMKRRCCSHCQAEKTPQWRAGPMGPKSLCNACGVRYKSGRLVPEYRPAASPSFDSFKHSNFHKRILKRKMDT
ncbi:GATA transcription factor 4 [Ziziphus jujuba]|uniref:GATA transcription factor 4 n=1 Tax=Ziziphus jujuba TaxID=326968 RepID=A0A6P4AQ54_ZIZJJ|nr:GATA transcription factor 4 [Ziziphus jujuba]